MTRTYLPPDINRIIRDLRARIERLERKQTPVSEPETSGDGGHDGAGTSAVLVQHSGETDATADGDYAVAIGNFSSANYLNGVAVGPSAWAGGDDGVAVGSGATVDYESSDEFVSQATAVGASSFSLARGTAVGYDTSSGEEGVAVGYQAVAGGAGIAVGAGAQAELGGDGGIAIGQAANVNSDADGGVSIGADSWVVGDDSTAVGKAAHGNGENSTAVGADAHAGVDAVALGASVSAVAGTFNAGNRHPLLGCRSSGGAGGGVSLGASQFTVWVNETTDELTFEVKYEDGTTIKSGTVALT